MGSGEQAWERVAYIAPADDVPADGSMLSPESRFRAHVESYTDAYYEAPAGDGVFESAEAAIAWARERAPIVMIRLGGTEDTYFSAGEVLAEDEDGGPYPAWPPDEPPGGWSAPGTPVPIDGERTYEISVAVGQLEVDPRPLVDAAKRACARLGAADPRIALEENGLSVAFSLFAGSPEEVEAAGRAVLDAVTEGVTSCTCTLWVGGSY